MQLVPRPRSYSAQPGALLVTEGFSLLAPPTLASAARWWQQVSINNLGIGANLNESQPTPGYTPLRLDLGEDLPNSSYELEVTPDGIGVTAGDLAGAQNALQTLRQLLDPENYRAATDATSPWQIPLVRISDEPRFEWRGVLLDVARHFMPVAGVLRFIDQAAVHKLNRILLHLTDDQGWRVEIDAYPKLTEVGAWRTNTMHGNWRKPVDDHRPHGGFYTKAQLREIVAYARQRGITVVPEINVPGHTQAVVASYPELGVKDSNTQSPTSVAVLTSWGFSQQTIAPTTAAVEFFTTVLTEVLEVFDSPWICLGGDEVVTRHWVGDPRLVAQAAQLGLQDPGDLQYWFLRQLSEFVVAQGRTPMFWDEALQGDLVPQAVVLAWRGAAVAQWALDAGYDTIMAPEQFVYLDHRAADGLQEPIPVGFVRTVEDLAQFEPDPQLLMQTRPQWIRQRPGQKLAVGAKPGRLLGAQAQVWTEHLDSARRVDYATYPRLAAFAETVWTARELRDTADLLSRIKGIHSARLAALGIEFRPDAGPHPWQQRPGLRGWFRDVEREGAVAGWVGAAAYFNWHDLDPNVPNPELEATRVAQPYEDEPQEAE